jgi:hypothetical protein
MEELHRSLTTFEDMTNYNIFTFGGSCSYISLLSNTSLTSLNLVPNAHVCACI